MLYYPHMSPHKNKNVFIFFLTMLGITAAVVGIYQMYSSVYGPLKIPGGARSISEQKREIEKSSIQYLLSLQRVDTDGDGLSDYDEAYSYGTSLYLPDTDSDGIDDKAELVKGDDPRCHKDKVCDGEEATAAPSANDVQEQIPNILPGSETLLPQANQTYIPSEPNDANGEFTIEELRAMLAQSGFNEEQLNAFSDEELMQTWQEVLQGGGQQ